MVTHWLEITGRSQYDFESVILAGFAAFRDASRIRQRILESDVDARALKSRTP